MRASPGLRPCKKPIALAVHAVTVATLLGGSVGAFAEAATG